MNKKIFSISLLVIAWQLSYWIIPGNNFIIPQPIELLEAFQESIRDGEIQEHVLASLRRIIVGFSIATIAGIFLGILLGYYRKLNEYINPIIEILRPIPPIAWIPIAILLFGLGDKSSYFIVFLGAFFPIFTNTFFGVISLPKVYKNVSQTLELSRGQFLTKILFFYSLPNIFTGLKVGIGMAWMSVIAAELVGAQSGLGYFIQLSRLGLRTDKVFLGMILIGLLGYLLIKIIKLLEVKIIPWQEKDAET